ARPAALRRRGAVGTRADRGARVRAAGGGAGRRRPAGDRHGGHRAAISAGGRERRGRRAARSARGPGRARGGAPAGGGVRRRRVGGEDDRGDRGRGGAMTYAAVIVLHESRDELATLLESLREAPPLYVVDTGADDGGADLAREHGAQVI